MSISERDAILREREAFLCGAEWRLGVWQRALRVDHTQGEDEIAESNRRYPLPKVTRPRVVSTGNCGEWRFVEGRCEQRSGPACAWMAAPSGYVIPIGQAEEVLALRTNPTEEVEAEP